MLHNELGLENHISYPCAKFGENRLKIVPAGIDKKQNYIITEVGRHSSALNKSVVFSASFIWELMLPI